MTDATARRNASRRRLRRAVRPLVPLGLGVILATVFLVTTADSRQQRSGAGALSVRTGGGLVVMGDPEQKPWTGSFGSFFLCTETGEAVTIRRIRQDTPVPPLGISVQLREVTTDAPGIISARGEPPEFFDPKDSSRHRMEGSYSAFRPGLRVTRHCGRPGAAENGFTELLFVVKVDGGGGVIDRAWIDYTLDGEPTRSYTTAINWVMVLCGTETRGIHDEDSCTGRTDG